MTNNTLTAEQLVDAIRDADSLTDLQRLVGPAPEALQMHSENLHLWDRLWERKTAGTITPWDEERLAELNVAIGSFESRYL